MSKRNPLLLRGVISLLMASFTAIPVAQAQDAEPFGQAVIGFEGGLIGKDSATVIETFSEIGNSLATRTVVPEQTTGLCGILETELLIPRVFCTDDIVKSITALNERKGNVVDPNAINPKTGVILPDLKAEVKVVQRYFDKSDVEAAKRVENIDKNWGDFIIGSQSDVLASNSANAGDSVPEIEMRQIRKLEWTLPLKTEDDYFGAIVARKELAGRVRNLSLGVEMSAPQPKAAYIPPAATFKQWCAEGLANPGEGSYAEMTANFYGTDTAVECESQNGQQVRPTLAIVDQPIFPHPDLLEAVGASSAMPAGQCRIGGFDKDTSHGTMLASIVASSDNGSGFKGIAAGANIVPFKWTKSEGKNTDLKTFLEDHPEIPVVLFASNFVQNPAYRREKPDSDLAKKAQDAVWRWDGQQKEYLRELADSNVRFSLDVSRELMNQKSLFVVAAGQVEGGGRAIYEQSELAPQNIGETDEVLVVASCSDCTTMLPGIASDSNRNAGGGRSVAVMAPGGNMPFYVSPSQAVETVGGTSAASAFVAGLAARMFSCYPSKYRLRPGKLKERLILTSFPVSTPEAMNVVAGGVIDSSLAMLDPDATWLKTTSDDRPPRKVTVKNWCANELEITDENDNSTEINLRSTRRLAKVEDRIVQRLVEQGPKTGSESPKIVRRVGPGTLTDTSAKIALIDEPGGSKCVVAADGLVDLILNKTVSQVGACADSLPVCN
jgi:Subtilase family